MWWPGGLLWGFRPPLASCGPRQVCIFPQSLQLVESKEREIGDRAPCVFP